MKWVIWGAVLLLALLHYDFWYWSDRRILFGFLPIGLAFHAGFSVVAALVWLSAVKFLWPTQLEEWADQEVTLDSGPEQRQ